MSRANDTAFPSAADFNTHDGLQIVPAGGLTVREEFAKAAMQAILTGAVTRGCPCCEWTDQDMSVRVADALIAALSKGDV